MAAFSGFKIIPALLPALLIQPGFGCKCSSPRSLEDAKSVYANVFHGKAIRVEEVRMEFNGRLWKEKLVTFVTDTIFNGRASDTLVLRYQSGMNFCASRKQNFGIGSGYSIGVDGPSAHSVLIREKMKDRSKSKEPARNIEAYLELDDCGFVQKDSLAF